MKDKIECMECGLGPCKYRNAYSKGRRVWFGTCAVEKLGPIEHFPKTDAKTLARREYMRQYRAKKAEQ